MDTNRPTAPTDFLQCIHTFRIFRYISYILYIFVHILQYIYLMFINKRNRIALFNIDIYRQSIGFHLITFRTLAWIIVLSLYLDLLAYLYLHWTINAPNSAASSNEIGNLPCRTSCLTCRNNWYLNDKGNRNETKWNVRREKKKETMMDENDWNK